MRDLKIKPGMDTPKAKLKNPAPKDADSLLKQMSYVDNAPAGHGLIKVGGAIVPFANELPKNTELYRLMSTRPGED